MMRPVTSYPPKQPPSPSAAELRALTAEGARPRLPLAELLAMPELEASLVVPRRMTEALARTPIVGVPVIDLADPQPHLIGAELLLTTGLGLVDEPEWMRRYVRGVRESGTVGIGFGIEPVYPAVPEHLVAACAAEGVPLIAFPPHISFVHITTAFFTAIERERLARLDRLNALALRIMRAARSPSPDRDVVQALASFLGGMVVFERGEESVSAGGVDGLDAARVLAEAPGPRAASGTAEQPSRAAAAHGHRLARLVLPDGVEVLSADVRSSRSRLPARSRLVAAAPRQIGGTDLTAIHLAVDALQLVHAGGAMQSAAVDALLMELLLEALARGDRAARQRSSRRVAAALGGGKTSQGIACVARRLDGGPAHAADLAWWRTELATPFVDIADQALRAIVLAPPSIARRRALREEGWLLHLSDPAELDRLPEAFEDGLVLSRRALALRDVDGDGMDGGADVDPLDGSSRGGPRRWAGVADRAARAAASKRFFAPLRALPPEEAEEILRVLACWLAHNGGWDASARELGLHRNTVRRLVARAEQAMRLPFDDARVRAELLLALDALPTVRREGGSAAGP